jgi:hypothetical protein
VRTADDIYENLVNMMPNFVDPQAGAIGPNLDALIRAIATEMAVTQEQAECIGQAMKTVSGELKDVDKRLRQIEASRHVGELPTQYSVDRSSFPAVDGCERCAPDGKEDALGRTWFGPCDRHFTEYLTGQRKP